MPLDTGSRTKTAPEAKVSEPANCNGGRSALTVVTASAPVKVNPDVAPPLSTIIPAEEAVSCAQPKAPSTTMAAPHPRVE
jgi:hypothetical protein